MAALSGYFLRSSMNANIKRAAIHGRTFGVFPALVHEREHQTGGHPWPHFSIMKRRTLQTHR
jgi:hypothetical protein